MSALVFTNFGGIAPRVPSRRLGDNYGQLCHNLLPSAQEFRPLQKHAGEHTLDGASGATRTIYRMERNAGGDLHTNVTEGLKTYNDRRSFARAMLNDDATERTIVTMDDGSAPPRVIDAKGADRPLGVPAPAQPAVKLRVVPQFTQEDADAWLADKAIPTIAAALRECLQEEHWVGGRPLAGSLAAYGLAHHATDGRFAYKRLTLAQAKTLGLHGVEGYAAGSGNWDVAIQCCPKWGRVVQREALQGRLRALERPTDGAQAIGEAQIAGLAARLEALFDPNGSLIAAARSKMDAAVKAFTEALAGTTTTTAAATATARPAEPAKPKVPEYDAIGFAQRNRQWEEYDAAMVKWRADVAAWEQSQSTLAVQQASATAAVQQAQAAAAAAHDEIFAIYQRQLGRLEEQVSAIMDGSDGAGQIELSVGAPRQVELRYYVVTYVTDWGWESAPSPLSAGVEMDQNDECHICLESSPPGGYGITRWRVYRSNAGTSQAAFQFVEELLVGQTKYVDTVPSDRLGEVCPSWGWAMPPYREDKNSAQSTKPPRGSTPYLRGAVAMPNGIIAGFIDNFVAFCDPYHPYAWPPEYQITTEHPIVGLGVFGQTLFVGTMGYPYLISGADSASMSAVKLTAEQPCVSRRSIVTIGDGVVYASPDGLCLASSSGVRLLTEAHFAREDWQALHPSNISAIAHEGIYYFWADGKPGWTLDIASGKLGTVEDACVALCRSVTTDALYAIHSNGRLLSGMYTGSGYKTGRWKSRVVQSTRQEAFAWCQVDGDQSTATPATVRWWGDGVLRYTARITDTAPHRLPTGRWLEHEIEVQSAARITAVRLASTTAELQKI